MEIIDGRITGATTDGHIPQLFAGLFADRPPNPGIGDFYISTDSTDLYVCYTAGVWTYMPKGIQFQEDHTGIDRELYMAYGGGANTVAYQNTSQAALHVNVTITDTFGRQMQAFSDGNAPPTTLVAHQTTGANQATTLSFIVLPGNYYMAGPSIESVTAVIESWIEWS